MGAWLGPVRRSGLASPLALVVAACSATGERAEPPPLLVDVGHFAGTVLTGPTADEPAPDEAWGLALRVAILEELPEGEPLAPRLVVIEGTPEPFAARAELALGARRVPVAMDSPPRWETRKVEALIPGGATVLTLASDPLLPDAPRTA